MTVSAPGQSCYVSETANCKQAGNRHRLSPSQGGILFWGEN